MTTSQACWKSGGICAVAVDRPGYGATDPLDDLDLIARTRDAVAVAGHLGMTRFAVQGSSGGGPYAANMMEATRQGAAGWWADGQAFGQPWPFDVADIRAPVHVFHGGSDTLAPLPVLRRSLARAGRVTEDRIYPGGHHFAPWATRERQAAMLAVIPG